MKEIDTVTLSCTNETNKMKQTNVNLLINYLKRENNIIKTLAIKLILSLHTLPPAPGLSHIRFFKSGVSMTVLATSLIIRARCLYTSSGLSVGGAVVVFGP
jgi:hypothetical protein